MQKLLSYEARVLLDDPCKIYREELEKLRTIVCISQKAVKLALRVKQRYERKEAELKKEFAKLDYSLALLDGRYQKIAPKKEVPPKPRFVKEKMTFEEAKVYVLSLPPEQRKQFIEQLLK